MRWYFQASNATRPVGSGGIVVQFEVVGDVAGTTVGVYTTEDAATVAALQGDPRVKGISQEDYDLLIEKKKRRSLSSRATTPGETPKPAVAAKAAAAERAIDLIEIDAEEPPADPLKGVGARDKKKRGAS